MPSLDHMSPATAITEGLLLETYFEVIPFAVYVIDVHTYELVYANAMLRRFLPHPIDYSKPCHELLFHEAEPCRFCKIKHLQDENGLPNLQTYVHELYDEIRERWLQLHEKAINWPDGRTVKYTICVDITELKAMQSHLAEAHAQMALMNRELQEQNRLLQEHLRLREDVERMARHDLKTPLAPIITFPQLILEEHPDLPPRTVEALQCITAAGGKILNLVNKTLDLLKLEQGIYPLDPQPMNVFALLRSPMRDLAPLLRERGVTFSLLEHGVPAQDGSALLVAAEEMLCYSLFSNVLKNAVQASPRGGVVVVDVTQESSPAATPGASPPPPGQIRIRLENQGEVPTTMRDRFFDKYATASRDGSGIGTYAARLIAQVHGGSIEMDSGRPGWTTVTIHLPAAA